MKRSKVDVTHAAAWACMSIGLLVIGCWLDGVAVGWNDGGGGGGTLLSVEGGDGE